MAYGSASRPSLPTRVVVTGAGVVSPLGYGMAVNGEAFQQGRRGLKPVTVFDTSKQRTEIGGEVDVSVPLPPCGLTPRQRSRLDRATHQLIAAGLECMAGSRWNPSMRQEPVPLCFGTSAAAMTLGEDYYRRKTRTPERQQGLAHLALNYQPGSQIRLLADALGVHGPSHIIANACASGSNSIGHAFEWIRSGRCRRAIAGGYDGLSLLVYAGFDSLQALSTTSPRPFAADRDGLALGEGAAVFTLERLEDAVARGAPLLGEIVGYGASTDLHHLTQPHPEGDAALASMKSACEQAGWLPHTVDYINAHGTGTPLNDSAEGNAICRWAGEAVSDVPVSSTKGSTGHLLGGAGSVELAIVLLAMQGGWLPPNVPVPNPDPTVRFQLVQQPTQRNLHRVLSNSFGFGGANATLAIQHPEVAPA